MPSTFTYHNPSSLTSLKPSTSQTSDSSQATSIYPIQQHKNKHKVSLQKIPVLHMYIPSTTKQT